MFRRISVALVGLALCMPIFAAAPVLAHTNGGLSVTFDTWTDAAGTHVAGKVTNHTSARRAPVSITATWDMKVDFQASATAFTSNLAPHATSPFHVMTATDVSSATGLTVVASGSITGTKPTKGIHIGAVNLVGDTATVNVTNDGGVDLLGVRVSAYRSGGANDDAAQSAAATLGASAVDQAFTITFDDDSEGGAVGAVIATTTSGATFGVSWNNYFGDLGTTNFTTEIAFLADEGITLGCGNSNFCPTAGVTRAEMAVFLDRAVTFADETGPDAGFTDIGSLSAEAQHAINVLADNGVTGGCSEVPKQYCPNQNVTRGQMSKFLATAYNLPTAVGTAFEDSFTDDDGHFSEPYNDQMKQAAITTGCTATTYCPSTNVKRDQMAKFLFEAETP